MVGLTTPPVSNRIFALLLCSLLLTGLTTPARAATEVHAGIGIIAVSGAQPGVEFALEDARGNEAGRRTTDAFGSLIYVAAQNGG
jgi:hypothetical protein